ncbi:MAG: MBL fold metallo-hydrolase, partial [Halieaceae bacterium]
MNARLIKVITLTLCAMFSALGQTAPYQVTVLATNISDYGGLGEWSFAALFESDQDAVLFDTGFKKNTVLHNVLHLGVDLSQVEKVVLSHFHSDHTGGLLILREHFRPANESALSQVYVAAGFFDQRVTETGVEVGPGDFAIAQDFRAAAEALGIRFIVVDEPTEIAPKLWLTGPVP